MRTVLLAFMLMFPVASMAQVKPSQPVAPLDNPVFTGSVRSPRFYGPPSGGEVNFPPSGGYWTTSATPANIVRLNDRVMIGAATQYDGTFGGNFPNWQWNMGRGIYAYLPRNAQMNVANSHGQTAGLFAADTLSGENLPFNPKSNCCSIGVGVQVFNNNQITPQGMWMIYGTGVRLPGTGSLVNEIDLANATPTVVRMNPYTPPQNGVGATIGLALQSGGEAVEIVNGERAFPDLSAATMPILIAGNGSTWDRGIVFRQLSISDQFPKAIDLPANYRMRWTHDDTDQTEAFISSNVGDYSKAMGLQFNGSGAAFQDPTLSGTYGLIQHVPNVANFPTLAGGPLGGPVYFAANGPDANIDVLIAPKGFGAAILPSITVLPTGTPPTSGAGCRPGQIASDAAYLYVCSGVNAWRRIDLGNPF